jgi:hypothetical protein
MKENGIIHLKIPRKHYEELEKAYEVCMHAFCSCRLAQTLMGFSRKGKQEQRKWRRIWQRALERHSVVGHVLLLSFAESLDSWTG